MHRTDKLAFRLGKNIQDLPDILGISRRTLFACRVNEDTVTAKTWLKLEAAEKAAGIGGSSGQDSALGAARSTSVNEFEREYGNKSPVEDDPFLELRENVLKMRRQLDEIANFSSQFSITDLIRAMTEAGAWPPAGVDAELTPGQLMSKYESPKKS